MVLPPIRPLLQLNQVGGVRNHLDTLRDVESAFHNADIALRNAREALRSDTIMSNRNGLPSATNHYIDRGGFRNGDSSSGRNGGGNNNVVDLTTLSSDNSNEEPEAQGSQPNHPTDAQAFLRDMGLARHPARFHSPWGPTYQWSQGRLVIDVDDWDNHFGLGPPVFTASPPPPDENAIRRQRQARRSWERVERRNRERAAEQAQRDAFEQARRLADQVSSNAGASSDTARNRNFSSNSRARRSSSESIASLASHISEGSLGSQDTDPTTNQNTQETSITASTDTMLTSQSVDLSPTDELPSVNEILSQQGQQQQQHSQQQTSAIGSQNLPNTQSSTTLPHATPLSTYRCAICMDTPTTATTTVCGHLFCHTCLKDSLKWSAQQRRDDAGLHGRRPPNAGFGLCPVCRKVLSDKENGNKAGIVGLEIRTISRKDWERRKKLEKENAEREEFLKSIGGLNTEPSQNKEKGKEKVKGKSRDDGKIKVESQSEIEPLPRTNSRYSRKRRRDESGQYDNTEGF